MSQLTRTNLLTVCLTFLSAVLSVPAQGEPPKELFVVKVNEKKGFIDKNGRIVIKPAFDQATDFAGGIARVWINCYPCERRFIDAHGKFVRNQILDEGPQLEFSEGLAAVKIGDLVKGRYGFIDNKGNVVIEPRFKNTFRFSEGLASVMNENNLSGYIDHSGTIVIEPKFESAWEFQEGLARVEQNGKWGFINKQGAFTIPPRFDDVSNFFEGRAMIQVNYKRGYIDRDGKVVIQPQFTDSYEFSNGLAYASHGKKYGFVDKNGGTRIRFIYDKVSSFSEGLAAVKRGGKFGYIDTNGKTVIPFRFSSAASFSRGLAYVSIPLPNGMSKSGYINRSGSFIWTDN